VVREDYLFVNIEILNVGRSIFEIISNWES